jgi:hypothetical protein
MIDHPLWELMETAQDCEPDCTGNDQHVQISPKKVRAWAARNGSDEVHNALDQLHALLSVPRLDWQAIAAQTGIEFPDERAARAWLGQWWDALVDLLDG